MRLAAPCEALSGKGSCGFADVDNRSCVLDCCLLLYGLRQRTTRTGPPDRTFLTSSEVIKNICSGELISFQPSGRTARAYFPSCAVEASPAEIDVWQWGLKKRLKNNCTLGYYLGSPTSEASGIFFFVIKPL